MLATQNIDDLHNQEIRASKILQETPDKYYVKSENNDVAFTPHVYEIHGSVLYMHCEDEEKECSKKFFKAPTLADAEKFAEEAKRKNDNKTTLVPTCEVCGKNMKPHSMFFDESYSEHYYRYKTVSDFVKKADCLIVVGTAL